MKEFVYIFVLNRILNSSVEAFSSNGDRRPETPVICLSEDMPSAPGEARRSNPVVLYRQGTQGMEGVFGLCPAKDRH
jgi:hypothetical protein